jgi:hypothetical protein
MATKLATGVYQLTPAEGLTLVLSATGTGFTVDVTAGSTPIPFSESGDAVKLTPADIGGAGIQTVNVRCFFTVGATQQAAYDLVVVDDEGAELDDIPLPIVPSQNLPYQGLIQLALIVRDAQAQPQEAKL